MNLIQRFSVNLEPSLTVALMVIVSGGAARADAPLSDRHLQPGIYGFGVASLELEDTTRPTPPNRDFPGSPTRPLPSKVWYPTLSPSAAQEQGALPGTPPSAPSGFPLIVFGHGITSEGAEGGFVAAHLATHGYVVIAPDFPLSKGSAPGGPTALDVGNQAGDVLFLTLALQDPALQAAFPVASLVDFDHIGVLGYSLGGATMALIGNDPSIDAVATLAPATCPVNQAGVPTALDKPLLILQGTTDAIVTDVLNSTPLFNASETPKFIGRIDNGSHGGFLTRGPEIEAAFPGVPLDAVLCAPLLELLGDDPIAQACGLCAALPTSPQRESSRQHDLTRAAALAFFNAYLRCDPRELRFLRVFYDAENADVDMTYLGGPAEGIAECLAP